MYNYRAYGLNIRSALPLPAVERDSDEQTDVEIRWGSISQCAHRDDVVQHVCEVAPQQSVLYWRGVGCFSVRQGREIWIDPCPDADEDLLRLPLVGAVWAILLHQRGNLVLHASAVGVHGAGMIFLGNSGVGKSTMAAALHARGHSFLADDIVAISPATYPGFCISPGFSHTRLSLSAARTILGAAADSLPCLPTDTHRRQYHIHSGFAPDSLPLSRVYILATGAEPGITRLLPQQAFVQLMQNSYVARVSMRLISEAGGQHLRQCSSLVQKAEICAVARPPSLARLAEVAELIEESACAAQ